MNKPRCFLLAGLITVLVGGCASVQPSTTDRSPGVAGLPTTGPAKLSVSALDLLTQSGEWPASQETINTANDKVTAACMQAHHLRFVLTPRPVTDTGDEAQVINLSRRSREGYGLSAPEKAATSGTQQDAYVAALEPAAQRHYMQTLRGSDADRVTINLPDGGQVTYPQRGCTADAIRALSGNQLASWAQLTYVPQQSSNDLVAQFAGDPAYRAAIGKWRACMQARDLPFTDPADAVGSLRSDYQASGPTAALKRKEIDTAVADGQCAVQAHLPLAVLAARRSLAQYLSEQQRRNLVTLTRVRAGVLQRARAVLAQS